MQDVRCMPSPGAHACDQDQRAEEGGKHDEGEINTRSAMLRQVQTERGGRGRVVEGKYRN